MNYQPKKLARHLVNFESATDLEAVVLARLGLSTNFIKEQTGLSGGQISYRLRKGKDLEGYGKGHTYRSEWRNGTGHLVRDAITMMVPVLRKEAKATLPKLVQHPTPEVSNVVELPDEVKRLGRTKAA